MSVECLNFSFELYKKLPNVNIHVCQNIFKNPPLLKKPALFVYVPMHSIETGQVFEWSK